ncbi:MAG TPA: nucleotidyltransferase family protein [Solirubrobacterales bacterium]
MIGGLVLAAGGGSRFGGGKLLAELDGRSLLEHALAAVAAVPAIERVVVVLGAGAERVAREADLGGAEVVVCEDWAEGIAASLRAGVAALADCEAIVITLGDQPFVTAAAIAEIAGHADAPAPAVRAVFDGRPGHPVLLKRELYERVGELRGDLGARDLLAAAGVLEVECGALFPPDDVDTRADLEAARRRLAG